MKLLGIYKTVSQIFSSSRELPSSIDREARMAEKDKRDVSGAGAARDRSAAARMIAEDLDAKARMEALLDEAIEETFPASDPISVAIPKRRVAK